MNVRELITELSELSLDADVVLMCPTWGDEDIHTVREVGDTVVIFPMAESWEAENRKR